MARRAVTESLRRARHEVYRRALVDAAEHVFAERGFVEAKMQDVAKRAGISVGVVYDVFDGKEALLAAVHGARGEELLHRARAVLDAESALEVLHAGIRVMVAFFEEHPSYLRLHLRDGALWSHPELSRELDRSTWAAGLDLLTDAFERGRAEGTLVDDEPRASARLLMAMQEACLADWLLARPRPAAETVVERLSSLVDRTFVRRERKRIR